MVRLQSQQKAGMVHLMEAIQSAWDKAMTPARIEESWRNTGLWPTTVAVIAIGRLRSVKGEGSAARDVDLPLLKTRLKPEAVRQLEEVEWSDGSISNTGKAVLANCDAVLAALSAKAAADESTAAAAAARRAKRAEKQQEKDRRAIRSEVEQELRRLSPRHASFKARHRGRRLRQVERLRIAGGGEEFDGAAGRPLPASK
eukprot:TRINITY_DN9831_c0_g1_i1.p2 TRINITY_DN9831_c0_g1~~TRINITY_DN9831_c0_g1_i1.p2  ORF type:complete len:200 (-),score=38.85 TRINITY_DN9831_c0_g1_i1:3-602(-)